MWIYFNCFTWVEIIAVLSLKYPLVYNYISVLVPYVDFRLSLILIDFLILTIFSFITHPKLSIYTRKAIVKLRAPMLRWGSWSSLESGVLLQRGAVSSNSYRQPRHVIIPSITQFQMPSGSLSNGNELWISEFKKLKNEP